MTSTSTRPFYKAFLALILLEICPIKALCGVSAFLAPTIAYSSRSRHSSSGTPAMAPARTPNPLRYTNSMGENESEIASTKLSSDAPAQVLDAVSKAQQRQAWINRSISYYSKVMREERRRELGQINDDTYDPDHFQAMAKKHYFALRKIKDGKPHHAERIYRRIIDELLEEEDQEECDHAKLAVTTLLLALLLQREGHAATQTRSVFLHFFRNVHDSEEQCACSAKV